MTKHLHNWTYENVTDFLKEKGFEFFDDVAGVGKAWIKFKDNGEPDRMVEVKYTPTLYLSKALNKMIRQSGIDQEEWAKWECS